MVNEQIKMGWTVQSLAIFTRFIYFLFQVFGEAEFLEYQQALNELADV